MPGVSGGAGIKTGGLGKGRPWERVGLLALRDGV